MRRRRTIAIACATAAALCAGCGGGTGTTAETRPATQVTTGSETAEPTTVPGTGSGETVTTGIAVDTAEDGGSGDEKADAVIRIEGGEPVGGPATVKVRKGDRVRIVVRADADDELHLHGYEIEKTVGPGKPAIFAFTAEFEGIFELESHHAGALVAKVVVEP